MSHNTKVAKVLRSLDTFSKSRVSSPSFCMKYKVSTVCQQVCESFIEVTANNESNSMSKTLSSNRAFMVRAYPVENNFMILTRVRGVCKLSYKIK